MGVFNPQAQLAEIAELRAQLARLPDLEDLSSRRTRSRKFKGLRGTSTEKNMLSNGGFHSHGGSPKWLV